jgi:hypothetical protein
VQVVSQDNDADGHQPWPCPTTGARAALLTDLPTEP